MCIKIVRQCLPEKNLNPDCLTSYPIIIMEKDCFDIFYNGRKTAVNRVSDDTFAVQISYKALYIKRVKGDDGQYKWCNVDENHESVLSKELGELIAGHPCFAEAV